MNLTRVDRFLLSIIIIFSAQGISSAQQATVSGTVRDINSHKEVPNVNIFIKGKNVGTASDESGKFSLLVRGDRSTAVVIFQHIAFEPLELPFNSLRKMRYVYLQPRIIPLQGVEVSGEAIDRPEIQKDLPQSLAIVEARDFEIRGYVDAGDLLRTDHSVQVDEELSGKKTVAIRGGNADEVVVMYNGVKMNSVYDNVFDLSLIDLEDIQRFEIIKGSNTALYGPDAFSGVINIVPKTRLDYSFRFQQRIGTYRSGNWGLHISPENLFWETDKLRSSYSYKRGALKRNFDDLPGDEKASLRNEATHHTATLGYTFDDGSEGRDGRSISAMFIRTDLDYRNDRDNDEVGNSSQLYSLRYTGDVSNLQNYNISVSYKQLGEKQNIVSNTGFLNRDIDDRSYHLNAENAFAIGSLKLLLGYQFEGSELDFLNDIVSPGIVQSGLKSGLLKRQHHGVVSIAKFSNEIDAQFLQSFDLNFSVRHDIVKDKLENPVFREGEAGQSTQAGNFGKNDWQETIVKMSVNLAGLQNDLALQTYLNFGRNAKFPTLFQQISLAEDPANLQARRGAETSLLPEKNNSIEIGAKVSRQIYNHPAFYGWEISGLYFQNHYDNKIVTSAKINSPVARYFNVPDAMISGLELQPSVYMYKKKLTLEFGFSKYWISDKQAFPFKSDVKRTLSLIIDHAGYNFQALWFKEGEQIGNLLQLDGTPVEVIFPDFSNLDLHLSKTFSLYKFKLFLNISGRNLLNSEELVLEGIALRDRRYYITVGSQF